MRLKILLGLLVAVLMAIPQFAYSQEEDDESEEYADPNQPIIDSLLNAIKPDSPDSVKAINYNKIACIISNIDSCLKYAFLSLNYCKEDDIYIVAQNNGYIGWAYYMKEESRKAMPYLKKGAYLFQSINDYSNLSNCYRAIAQAFEDFNQYDSIKHYFNLAIETAIKCKDSLTISESYLYMGEICCHQGYLTDAEQYTRKAIEIDSLMNDSLNYAYSYSYLGDIYISKFEESSVIEDALKAKNYHKTAIKIFETIDTDKEIFVSAKYLSYSILSSIYINLAYKTNNDNYADSCAYYQKIGFDYFKQQHSTHNIVMTGYTYVSYLKYLKKYKEALQYLFSLKQYIHEETSKLSLKDYNSQLKEVYLLLGDYRSAYECFEKETEYKEAHLNDSSMTALAEMKTEQAMMIERMDREKAEAIHIAEKQKMRIIIFSLVAGLALISLLVFYIFRVLKLRKTANAVLAEKNQLLAEQNNKLAEQKEEIESQRDEIMAQRDHIEAQSKEIQASINYARRIQRALLTPDEAIGRVFSDYFLLYKPRSVVSGDFYWVGQFGDNKVCIVADCTGHGVPGGFMSVLGMTNLNYIVSQEIAPDAILNKLREAIISNLRQSNSDENLNAQVYDGMDVAAYVVNEKQMTLSFAGANNPLILIRDNEVQIIKPDRMPVGISIMMKPFNTVTVELRKGDCLYTFSDGFQDQFGYNKDRKFQKSRLRNLLLEIHTRPMSEQRELLNLVFKEWRGPAENQTDDVVIMGVRI